MKKVEAQNLTQTAPNMCVYILYYEPIQRFEVCITSILIQTTTATATKGLISEL